MTPPVLLFTGYRCYTRAIDGVYDLTSKRKNPSKLMASRCCPTAPRPEAFPALV
jgi:hypothetical protein